MNLGNILIINDSFNSASKMINTSIYNKTEYKMSK